MQVLRYFMWNMFRKVKYWLVIVVACFCTSAYSTAIDSVGLEKKDNKWFIKHEVQSGETFYRLSTKYGVDIEDIMRANANVSILSVGQVLFVPYSDLPYFLHKVKEGETIYAISRIYGIETAEISEWNNLSNSDIQTGDRLKINRVGEPPSAPVTQEWTVHIVKLGESLFGIAKLYSVEVDSLKSWNYLTSNDIQEGMYLRFRNSEQPSMESASTEVVVSANVEEVDTSFQQNDIQIESPFEVIPLPLFEERGMAALIEGSEGNQKFLALHRTAPPGTIMVVRNELNNQVVFVRVIGQLPDTGANEKLVVKISETAWKNVHAVNPRFRVKVSYFR